MKSKSQLKEVLSFRPKQISYSFVFFILSIALLQFNDTLKTMSINMTLIIYEAVLLALGSLLYFSIFKGRKFTRSFIYFLQFILLTSSMGFINNNLFSIGIFFISLLAIILSFYFLLCSKTLRWLKVCKLARKGLVEGDIERATQVKTRYNAPMLVKVSDVLLVIAIISGVFFSFKSVDMLLEKFSLLMLITLILFIGFLTLEISSFIGVTKRTAWGRRLTISFYSLSVLYGIFFLIELSTGHFFFNHKNAIVRMNHTFEYSLMLFESVKIITFGYIACAFAFSNKVKLYFSSFQTETIS